MTPTKETYHFRGKVGLSWDRYINNLRLLVREYLKRLACGRKMKNSIVIRVMATQDTASNVNITETEIEASAILHEWSHFVAEVEKELGIKPFAGRHSTNKGILRGNRQRFISYPLQKGVTLVFWRAFTFANTRVGNDFELEMGQTEHTVLTLSQTSAFSGTEMSHYVA